MSFDRYTWKDREGTNLNRRTLTDASTQSSKTVDVERVEGTVYSEGIQYDADTMNDLEDRLEAAFNSVAARLQNNLDTFYPVGSVYLSMDNTSPAALFGGTWESIIAGVLVPAESSGVTLGTDTISYRPQGSVAFSGSIQPALADLPVHNHITTERLIRDSGDWKRTDEDYWRYNQFSVSTAVEGGNQPHNHAFYNASGSFSGYTMSYDNRMPSITVYAWRRVE